MTIRTLLLIAVQLCTFTTLSVAAPPKELLESAKQSLRAAIPTTGAIHLSFASPEGAGEAQLGFDATTNAWYFLSGGEIIIGVDAKGVAYHGSSEDVEPLSSNADFSEQEFAHFFPWVAASYYLERADSITSIEPLGDGVLRLTMPLPEGRRFISPGIPAGHEYREPAHEHMDIADSGRILAIWIPKLGERKPFSYNNETRPPFDVPSEAQSFTRVVVQLDEHPTPDSFSMKAGLERSKKMHTRIRSALKQRITSVEYIRRPADAPSLDPASNAEATPAQQPAPARISWPVAAAGCAVLVIAGIVWYRRRA